MLDRGPTASAARTRRAASPGESRSPAERTCRIEPSHSLRQPAPLPLDDGRVIDQGQPVPDPLEALQETHQPGVVAALQPATLHHRQQVIEARHQPVQA